MNHFAYLASRFSFQIGQLRADAKEMTIGGRNFDPRQHQKAVDRLAVGPHQTFFEHVGHRVAGVVIGHGNAVQTFRARARNQIFRARDAVAGEKRMSMEIEIKRHLDGMDIALQVSRAKY
jgi:hypothetical protein